MRAIAVAITTLTLQEINSFIITNNPRPPDLVLLPTPLLSRRSFCRYRGTFFFTRQAAAHIASPRRSTIRRLARAIVEKNVEEREEEEDKEEENNTCRRNTSRESRYNIH